MSTFDVDHPRGNTESEGSHCFRLLHKSIGCDATFQMLTDNQPRNIYIIIEKMLSLTYKIIGNKSQSVELHTTIIIMCDALLNICIFYLKKEVFYQLYRKIL